jgi:ABC-type Mn2+/Zn2+ transport system ATPase subunit
MQDVIVVSVKNVTYTYNNATWAPFSSSTIYNISFTVTEGDLLGIIGPNGAGKSTLFKCMLGLIEDYRGQITIFGNNLQKNKKVLQRVGYIPQTRSIEQNFPATMLNIVSRDNRKKGTFNNN